MNKGFTLVELLIYLAIVSGMLVSFIIFTLNAIAANEKGTSASELVAGGRFAFQVLLDKIRESQAVIAPATGVVAASLTLDRPAPLPDLIFSVNNGALWLEEVGGNALALTASPARVEEFSVTNLGSNNGRANLLLNLRLASANPDSQEFITNLIWRTAVTHRASQP